MANGARHGGTEEGHAKVFLIRPQRESPEVAGRVLDCRRHAEAEGFSITIFRSREARMHSDSPERPVDFLAPDDAHGLYRSLHRAPSLVLAFATAYVRRDPSRNPPARRAAVRLDRFVDHKAIYGLVRSSADGDRYFEQFANWRDVAHCGGDDDPRVLPLHVFETARDWRALGHEQADNRFRRLYGPAGRRYDEGEKLWARATDRHGRDELVVAGCRLQRGMHWDVSTGRAKATLHNSNAVWILTRRGYLNVYPDAGTRRAPRAGRGAKQVWPR